MKINICETCREEIEAKHDPKLERIAGIALMLMGCGFILVVISACKYWMS